MAQIGEGVAIGMIKESNDECWFCKEQPQKRGVSNDLEASPDTSDSECDSSVTENDVKNDASVLGKNLGAPPEWIITCPLENISTFVIPGAHHCIPGTASFKKVMDMGLSDFVNAGGEFNLVEDIGYSINHENNGVWLPGNYAVREGIAHYTKTWSAQTAKFKKQYAERAMESSNRQFHDAHVKYNNLVRKTLENVMNKIGEPEGKCPFCGEEYDSTRPPYGLVARLDRASRAYKNALKSLSSKTERKKKQIGEGCYTSSRVKKYFNVQ